MSTDQLSLLNRLKGISQTPTTINNHRHASELARESTEIFAEIFPCENPRNPAMVDPQTRKATFINWQRHRMQATIDDLVEAGFLYLDQGDKLKCFYCNGGLQHWQYNENPWFEHAKWYPNCEYLLRKKGIAYVQKVGQLFPALKRPVFQFPQSSSQQSSSSSQSCAASSQNFSPFHSNASRGITAADNSQESPTSSSSLSSHNTGIEKAMQGDIARGAVEMGFDENLVAKLVKRKLEREKTEYQTMLNLIEDLQTAENDPSAFDLNHDERKMQVQYHENDVLSNLMAPPPQTLSDSVESNSSDISNNNEATRNKIEDIKNEQTCKVCLDRISDCVFVPCGHVCCCITCGSALRKCPICRESLEKIIKFYR